jgi:hypothetical protein
MTRHLFRTITLTERRSADRFAFLDRLHSYSLKARSSFLRVLKPHLSADVRIIDCWPKTNWIHSAGTTSAVMMVLSARWREERSRVFVSTK